MGIRATVAVSAYRNGSFGRYMQPEAPNYGKDFGNFGVTFRLLCRSIQQFVSAAPGREHWLLPGAAGNNHFE